MKYFVSLILMLLVVQSNAQHMFDYSDIKAGKFRAKSVYGLTSMADGEHYTVNEGGKIGKYSYRTGERVSTVFDVAAHPELKGKFDGYEFSADERRMLITTNTRPIYRHSFTADFWVYDIASGTLKKLTERGREQEAAFSPDGTKVGFVRENNIYLVDLTGYGVTPVTTDGRANEIINGHTDWVYEEEYAFTRAFEFSNDGKSIAYLRFDERAVPEYTMMIFGGGALYPHPYTYKYPKAGERNSTVELYVYSVADGRKTKIDTGAETDQYIPRIGWTPDNVLFFYRVNRLQNHFEVLLADGGGASKVLYSEEDRKYVERPDAQTVTFLPKGKFLVKSERSGFMHLYVHNDKGIVTDTVTRGNWEITSLVDVDKERAYYLSTEGSPLRRNLWSVRLNGKGKMRLTQDEGTFTIAPSKGFKYFISYFSNVSTPNLVRLHDSAGKVLRTLEDNAELKKTISARKVPRKEFFTVTTMYGNTLNGYMIKPLDFDPAKKYPVLMYQYSGPGSQEVLDRWTMDWTDVLPQEGYIVACVDGRGTGGRGAEFRKCTYGNLGDLETRDQIEAAKWLATQQYVDKGRIGIYGWSYGGFMSLNCMLKGGDLFKMAIAVAPVTSWRFYDTIYTEIYNGLPQDNPRGYDDNSPINFAANLKGRLLIAHGTADDNVLIQNTYRMAQALTTAGKQFDMMIYPDDNHSMVPNGRHSVREKMVEYTLKNL